ncbi:hypothetical protein FB565_006830 [Actinoplanes lutulentus]|uniref:Uncharacterized protein n=1 Tax=Actinoplanes lutulentus TaxID=1287878 RepID=A0A327Z4K5_9ACTN|nr:hypothetical protein [Actinoplanes lutulentus]RAK30560.1 hypothetical protein B0I29_116219 [Actinoplanes lutulentus]
MAAEIDSVAAGLRLVWDSPEISGEFTRVWELPEPPAA